MAKRDLRKLKRVELLEIITAQSKKIEQLEEELASKTQELEARHIRIDLSSPRSRDEARAFFDAVFSADQQMELPL